jgi:hypothetical protein
LPVNKNALIRYHALDKCFSNPGRNYFIEDLLEACNEAILTHNQNASGIQRRQLFEDIKFMESSNGWEIPLKRIKSGKKVYYRYSDPKFSINNYPISISGFDKIKEAMKVFKRIKGIPEFYWIRKLFLKLEESIVLQKEEYHGISFDSDESLRRLDFIGDIFQNILEKKALCISFQTHQIGVSEEITMHPYYLKQFKNRWFLLGYKSSDEALFHLDLSSIQSIKTVNVPYISSDIDFEAYFENVYGVTTPSESRVTKMVLKATPNASSQFLLTPMHPSQKIISHSEHGLLFSLELIPNEELEKEILSYGEYLTLLEPENFRIKLRDRLLRSIDHYDDNQGVEVSISAKRTH